MTKYKNVIFFIILIEIILTAYLYFSGIQSSYICLNESSCRSVQNSIYGEIFGIKVGLFGFVAFLSLLLLYILAIAGKISHKLVLAAAFIGSIFAIYFIYLQIIVLREICSSCMVIDFGMIIISIFILLQSSDMTSARLINIEQ